MSFNLYDELMYGELVGSGFTFSGTWSQSFLFDFLAGSTVLVNVQPTQTVPFGTSVKYLAGEVQGEETELQINTDFPLIFLGDISENVNLYFRVELSSVYNLVSPTVERIDIDVKQSTSLFTIATKVLKDGLGVIPFNIDPFLQNILIEYSWLSLSSHRDAIKKIAQAAGGVAYQDRAGDVNLISARGLAGTGVICTTLTDDSVINARVPVSDVRNRIKVSSRPYVALSTQTVWELIADKEIEIGQTRSFDIFFSDFEAVIDAEIELITGATVISTSFQTWGGRVRVEGTINGEVEIKIQGKPLVVRGARIMEAFDGDSIRRNGERVLTIEDNNLIQDRLSAQLIADEIIKSTGNERRDLEIDWRGNPALELGDCIEYNGIDYTIVESDSDFNGFYSASMKLRRV